MKTRIAVWSLAQNYWGGSFQYAKAFTQALRCLDREKFEIHVWHLRDEEWEKVCVKNRFREHVLDEYDIPPTFMPMVKKIMAILRTLPENAISERMALMKKLLPFSPEMKLVNYDPHIVISPQMGFPLCHKGAKHIGVIHDLMHRYERKFPEVAQPAEIAERDEQFTAIVRDCDTILVDSSVGMRHVLECYPQAREEQLKILPFTAFAEMTDATPEKPSFAVPEKFFLYSAQFWLHKNHVGIARAMAKLRNEFPDIMFIAAGNTEQNGFASFMEVVDNEGLQNNFILPGYISTEELNWLYRHARAYIMPTYFGPTNIPPLEAMALGCPLAVSNIYGMPEQCGNAALYFQPDNHDEIAGVMKKLWQDDELCQNLRNKGLERSQRYDKQKFEKLAASIVENLAKITK